MYDVILIWYAIAISELYQDTGIQGEWDRDVPLLVSVEYRVL